MAQALAACAGQPCCRRMVRALRNPNFRLFWSGNFLSNIGTWMQNVAQGWLVLLLTNSAFWLGVVGFAGSIPFPVFHALRRSDCRPRGQAEAAARDAVGHDAAGVSAGRAGVVQGDHGVGGGGDRVPERHGHGDECAQLPGAGAAAGEARRPDQRDRAELGAVQHVAHPGADAGRLCDGAVRRGGQFLSEWREFSGGAVGADAHSLSGREAGPAREHVGQPAGRVCLSAQRARRCWCWCG